MAIRYLLLAALVATCYCQDFCVFKAPEKEIDWSLMPNEPWKWAFSTTDPLENLLVCSKLSIFGMDDTDTITYDLKFGELKHQVFRQNAVKVGVAEYDLQDKFAFSWRNIVRHVAPKALIGTILSQEIDTPKKNHISFFTDYKNYLIAVICLPDGTLSVTVYTTRRYMVKIVENRIRALLEKHNINVTLNDPKCLALERGRQKEARVVQ